MLCSLGAGSPLVQLGMGWWVRQQPKSLPRSSSGFPGVPWAVRARRWVLAHAPTILLLRAGFCEPHGEQNPQGKGRWRSATGGWHGLAGCFAASCPSASTSSTLPQHCEVPAVACPSLPPAGL